MSCPHISNPINITSSLKNQLIFKDECTRCFINQNDTEGVNVCLTCFNGGCESHSREHFLQKNHPIVLKFNKTPIPSNEPEEQKIEQSMFEEAKIDIFLEEKHLTTTKLICLACNQELDPTPILSVIEVVKNSLPAAKKSIITEWEMDLAPCSHTKNLKQSQGVVLADKSLAHCSQCALTNNLWLCLICGALGCGRQQVDGSGGHGHALAHYQSTGHSVAVKTGTITPEGSASIYCYSCNEDVLDADLANHLRNFGLDINKMEKKEQTMIEMNLSANLHLETATFFDKYRKLTPIFGPGYTGIQNLGDSSYLSSVLQALLSLDEFRERYAKEGEAHFEKCQEFPPDCFHCQLSKVAIGLWSGKHSVKKETKLKLVKGPDGELVEQGPQLYQEGIRPFMFDLLAGRSQSQYLPDQHNNAANYLDYFLSMMQISESQEELDDITKLFKFKLVSKTSCLTCGTVRLNSEDTYRLVLNLPPVSKETIFPKYTAADMEEASKAKDFLLFLKKKEAEAEEKAPSVDYKTIIEHFNSKIISQSCSKCGGYKSFKKTHYIKNWPKYMVIEINRIDYSNWVAWKNPSPIKFPSETLDFSEFLLPPEDEAKIVLKNPNEIEEEYPSAFPDLTALLIAMGFSESQAKKALQVTNNNVEHAMNWLFENADQLENPDYMADTMGAEYAEMANMIVNMGFSEKQANYALAKTGNNVELAVEFLHNHPEIVADIMEDKKAVVQDDKMEVVQDPVKPEYEIISSIVHLGRTYQYGHNVCYVKKDSDWIYFNDAKVAKDENPAIGRGMLFILKSVGKDE